MGAPDLPDPGDEDLRPTESIEHPPIVNDESDNESDAYGYQPLALDEESADIDDNNEETASPQVDAFPNLITIEPIDIAITREVWNAPRPEGNQIELDTTRTAQILNAMANFTLPNAMIPEWAVNVPEEHWKDELLQRIRHRKEVQENKDTKEQGKQ